MSKNALCAQFIFIFQNQKSKKATVCSLCQIKDTSLLLNII